MGNRQTTSSGVDPEGKTGTATPQVGGSTMSIPLLRSFFGEGAPYTKTKPHRPHRQQKVSKDV